MYEQGWKCPCGNIIYARMHCSECGCEPPAGCLCPRCARLRESDDQRGGYTIYDDPPLPMDAEKWNRLKEILAQITGEAQKGHSSAKSGD